MSIFSHPINGTRYQEDNSDNVLLDCQKRKLSWETEDGELDGPIIKMVVPGHTTEVNFRDTGLYDVEGMVRKGLFIITDGEPNFSQLQTIRLFT